MGKYTKQSKSSNKKSSQVDTSIDEMYEQNAASPTGSKRTVVIVIALCMVLAILAGVYFLSNLGIPVALPGKVIANGVTIGSVDIGGMEKDVAVQTLLSTVGNDYSTTPMVVTILDQEFEITSIENVKGRGMYLEALVQEVVSSG